MSGRRVGNGEFSGFPPNQIPGFWQMLREEMFNRAKEPRAPNQTGYIAVKRICILHYKFGRPHYAETRTRFISELRLNLV